MPSRFLVAVVVSRVTACGVDGPRPHPPAAGRGAEVTVARGADVPADAIHHELVRIEQPFHPNDDYAIVIDAWVATGTLVDVRMGWVDTGAGDARSRFGKGVRRHVDVDHAQPDPRSWRITLVSGDARRNLAIVLDPDDRPVVWAMIDTESGAARCRVTAGRLVARRLLGLPVGLERLEVECADGTRGTVRGGDDPISAGG
jgi:predicted small lipoprotein YifL